MQIVWINCLYGTKNSSSIINIFIIIIIIIWKIYSLFTNFTALRIIQQLKVTVFTAYWQCDMKDLRIFVFFLHFQFDTFSCVAESVELAVEA